MKKIILFCAVMMTVFTSCSNFLKFFDDRSDYVDDVQFQSENYTMNEGGLVICTLKCEPVDVFDFYDAEFSVTDTEIAMIKSASDRSCTVKALKEGSTILTASVNGHLCQAVINVNARKY